MDDQTLGWLGILVTVVPIAYGVGRRAGRRAARDLRAQSGEQLMLILKMHQASIAGQVEKRLLKAVLNRSGTPMSGQLEVLKQEMVNVLVKARQELVKFRTSRASLKDYVERAYTPADIENDYRAIRELLVESEITDPLGLTAAIETIVEASQNAARQRIHDMIEQDLR